MSGPALPEASHAQAAIARRSGGRLLAIGCCHVTIDARCAVLAVVKAVMKRPCGDS